MGAPVTEGDTLASGPLKNHLGHGLTTVGFGGYTRATLTRSEPFFGQMISVRPSGRGWLSSSPARQNAGPQMTMMQTHSAQQFPYCHVRPVWVLCPFESLFFCDFIPCCCSPDCHKFFSGKYFPRLLKAPNLLLRLPLHLNLTKITAGKHRHQLAALQADRHLFNSPLDATKPKHPAGGANSHSLRNRSEVSPSH